MAKDNLKVKIRRVWKWTFIGIITFLVVSFFLKSSYPITHHKFNLADTYEVLKDTLTLAAAFLAPVTAFVLYTNWKDQHISINNEQVSKDILNIVDDFQRFKNISSSTLSEYEKFHKEEILFYQAINRLVVKQAEINAIDKTSKAFIDNVLEIQKTLIMFWSYFTAEVTAYNQIPESRINQSLVNTARFNASNSKFKEAEIKKNECFQDFEDKRKRLKILHV